jgi:hypothetical protein
LILLTPEHTCRAAPSWDKLKTCLQRFGTVMVRGERKGARLVEVRDTRLDHGGLYLYTQVESGPWRVGGSLRGIEYNAKGLDTYSLASAHGFRFDATASYRRAVSVGGTERPALHRRNLAVFCSGEAPECTEVLTSCDVYVGGRALWTFRGELTYGTNGVLVAGDRSAAGTECAQSESEPVPSASSM